MVSVLVLGAAALLVAPDRPVTACGPDFPTNMIVRRADALATMWDGSFTEEAAKLVPVSAPDRAIFTAPPLQEPTGARELALYQAGAERFHADKLDDAATQFQALLRLPPGQRRTLSAAAAFSLGRLHYARGDDAKAIAAFRQVRALVRAGFGDTQALAATSLGEEARIERERRGNLVRAVHLYAEQAALDDESGALSLLYVVRMADPADRAVLYRDDVGAKLLALYYYTRSAELSDEDKPLWERALSRQVTTEARGAAYLAAAAYRAGNWDAAARLAKLCRHAPIATWVQAKLALRDGDRARADALLREVERAGLSGTSPDSSLYTYQLDADPRSIVRGELGLVALADQRFGEAADWFARGMRLVEASYVAERALTSEELLAEVVRTRGARTAKPAKPEDDENDACSVWDGGYRESPACWAHLVLDIYARRMMREHHYAEALDAFGDTENGEVAKEFVAEMERADATAGVERAEHLYRASRILREKGMEISGTEVGPDWTVYDGDYERETLCMPSPTAGYGKLADAAYEDEYHDPSEGCLLPSAADAALVSPLEASRVAASAPEVPQRFAYRYAASRLAEAAANLVPPKSPAYAETMCWAAKYARRDQVRVEELYRTFVRNGAGGSDAFGESCDEPDFAGARTFDADQARIRTERAVAKARANAWTWPRIRAAAWRRKHWLALPFVAVLLIGLVRRRPPPVLGSL